MAKIYETETDIKRDRLKTNLATSSVVNEVSFYNGVMTGVTTGLLFIAKYFIPEKTKDFFGGSIKKNAQNGALLFGGMTLASVAAVIGSYFAKRKINAELDKLGPEEIIAPCCAEDYIKTKTGHAAQLAAKSASQESQKTLQ